MLRYTQERAGLTSRSLVHHDDAEREFAYDARWLVVGLTFQLAADIIETSISTSRKAIGRLAAIAARDQSGNAAVGPICYGGAITASRSSTYPTTRPRRE
jgi:hypothetical protein